MGIKLIRIKEFYELGDNNSINSLIPKIRVQIIFWAFPCGPGFLLILHRP